MGATATSRCTYKLYILFTQVPMLWKTFLAARQQLRDSTVFHAAQPKRLGTYSDFLTTSQTHDWVCRYRFFLPISCAGCSQLSSLLLLCSPAPLFLYWMKLKLEITEFSWSCLEQQKVCMFLENRMHILSTASCHKDDSPHFVGQEPESRFWAACPGTCTKSASEPRYFALNFL